MAGFFTRRGARALLLAAALIRCARAENAIDDQAPASRTPNDVVGGSSTGAGGESAQPGGGAGNAVGGGAGTSSTGASAGSGGNGGDEAGGGSGGLAGSGGSSAAGHAGSGGDGAIPGGAGTTSDGGEGGGSGIVGGDPYGGTPWPIPGTIQAEDFDLGGADVAYSDTTPENYGNAYRTNDGVDIETCTDGEGGYDVGWNFEGEWREYTVDVASDGSYTLSARVASPNDGAKFHVEVDGVDVTGALAVPNTAGFQNWQTVSHGGISLSKGVHVIRVVIAAAAEFNINWIAFAQ